MSDSKNVRFSESRIRLEEIRFMVDDEVAGPFCLELHPGDVCRIVTANPKLARGFLRTMATLDWSVSGRIYFNGDPLAVEDYRQLLFYKKRIAYLAEDSALLGNRNLKENLLLQEEWEANRLQSDLPTLVDGLCEDFGILDLLEARPNQMDVMQRRIAIAVRELAKYPELILIERPHDVVGMARKRVLKERMSRFLNRNAPIVFWSDTESPAFKRINRVFHIDMNGGSEEIGNGS